MDGANLTHLGLPMLQVLDRTHPQPTNPPTLGEAQATSPMASLLARVKERETTRIVQDSGEHTWANQASPQQKPKPHLTFFPHKFRLPPKLMLQPTPTEVPGQRYPPKAVLLSSNPEVLTPNYPMTTIGEFWKTSQHLLGQRRILFHLHPRIPLRLL